jgi:hypothetical protein
MIDLRARELADLGIQKPEGMDDGLLIRLYGGGTLIFDEYCRLKYHVRNKIRNAERQTQRLKYLWRFGFFQEGADAQRSFADMHRMRFI